MEFLGLLLIILIFGIIFLINYLTQPKKYKKRKRSNRPVSKETKIKPLSSSRENYSYDGFLSPKKYPVALTNHARERMEERLGLRSHERMDILAFDAYRYGKSARQLNRISAAQVRDIEAKHDNSVVLIYRNYIYVFSRENVLITVYKNEYIKI